MEQALTQFTVNILFDDSTGFGEADKHFATEADSMIDILYDLVRISLEYIIHLTETFTELSCLNVNLLFSMSLILVLCILGNIVQLLYITSVTKVHGMDNQQ